MARAARLPTTAVQAVGAKWRREVPPSRRRTAREQDLPWAVSSFPAPCCRVNHPTLTGGTPAAAAVCSRGVNAGSYRAGLKPVTVARPAKTPHDGGAVGRPVNAIGTPPTANNAAATRPDAIADGCTSDRLVPSRTLPPLTSSRRRPPPLKPSRLPPRIHRDTDPTSPWASARPKSSKNRPAGLATGPAVTSSSSPHHAPPIKNSVRAHAARRYDASDSGKPASGSGATAADGPNPACRAEGPHPTRLCRHILRMPSSKLYLFFTPQNREGSGWAGPSGPPFPGSDSSGSREVSHGTVTPR
jgi:hypothetical protein